VIITKIPFVISIWSTLCIFDEWRQSAMVDLLTIAMPVTSGTYNIHIQDENKLSNIPQKNILKQEKNGKNRATSSEKF
jgi:hypothetical protein